LNAKPNPGLPGPVFWISSKSSLVLIAGEGKSLLEWKGLGLRR
jgi:hypothetical protein